MRSLVVIALLLLVAGTARADDAHAKDDVYWHDEWPRFSLAEGLVTVGVTAQNLYLDKGLDEPRRALVEFYVPVLDKGARTLLREKDEEHRKAAQKLSDVGFRVMVLAPYVVDAGLTLTVRKNPDVALQLALIDAEVLTLAGSTQLLVSRLLGRARPYVQDSNCHVGGTCPVGDYRSLLSGHTMATFTGAALMCSHHENVPIFGGGAADKWACVWGMSVAATTGVLRIASDEHWASDVVLGAFFGGLYGYVLPKVLHFHDKKPSSKPTAIHWMPSLVPQDDGGVLSINGSF